MVYKAQHGYCKLCLDEIVDYHHKIPNTKTNNKLYPLFIQSIFNCAGLCRHGHQNNRWHGAISVTYDEAMAYESWLRGFKTEEVKNEI